MTNVTATARPTWGTYRSNLTRCASRIAWSVLTPAQGDVLFLNKLADTTLSLRQIAAHYRVTEQTVSVHLRRGIARLADEYSRAGLELAGIIRHASDPAPKTSGRVSCAACDTPGILCADCLTTLMRERAW
jgi:DNA-binding CsgD family transcriptional regulator